ncbi:YihY/virulence factor BrkB family protein [Avrilella dinanensis]|uniref:Ribonuclease BN n=1 Tax=Avrilella dinanensis TaxID=2008672 RepID=A0A2M9R6T0_9FLAO|nr:YihY/virulence factor BrkB family protein [Avrilella dinanensis]PJR04578.1 ribonuclease BN [Avrilella dinanensis]
MNIFQRTIGFTRKIKLPRLEGLTLYDLGTLYIKGIIEGAFTYRAGSIAFSFFMALFPFALFILNLIPYIPIENFQEDFLSFVETSVPPSTYGAVESILIDIMNNSYKSLLSTGVLMSIFLMSNGVNAIVSGFESSYHISNTRNFIRQYIVALLLSLIMSVMLLFSLAVFLTIEVYMHFSDYPVLARVIRYVFIVSMIFLISCILYKYGAKETKKIHFFSIGAFFTTLLVIITSYGFGIYVTRFAQYNELYGSIGTLLVFMIYIWINCMILLLGFELNASIHRLKKNNSYISDNKKS